MTCIVAISQDGKVYMGGDSAASEIDSGMLTTVTIPKVFLKDEYTIGYAGSFRIGKLIQHSIEFPKPPSWAKGIDKIDEFMNGHLIPHIRKQIKEHELDSIEKEDFVLLVGLRGCVFEVDEAWAAFEASSNYIAIGSGAALALGSLYSTSSWSNPKKRMQTALEAAAKYNAYVEAPFTYLEN